MTKAALSPKELGPPVGPFSLAVQSNGLVFLSGQVGLDPQTKKLVDGGVQPQTAQAFKNLKLVLESAGKSFENVVRVGVYLTSISDFVAMNEIYATYFTEPYPARTTIAVSALPLSACVEIDMVAE